MRIVFDTSCLFLSRLCGGLRRGELLFFIFIFLSRLCGGLLAGNACNGADQFLSRLCGGLRDYTAMFVILLVSKPPVRRLTRNIP